MNSLPQKISRESISELKVLILRDEMAISRDAVPLVEVPLASSKSLLCDVRALAFNQTLTEFSAPLAR